MRSEIFNQYVMIINRNALSNVFMVLFLLFHRPGVQILENVIKNKRVPDEFIQLLIRLYNRITNYKSASLTFIVVVRSSRC